MEFDKINFVKTFVITFGALIGLNVLFVVIAVSASGSMETFSESFEDSIAYGALLFGSVVRSPFFNILSVVAATALLESAPAEAGNFLTYIIVLSVGWIITLLVASILAGIVGKSKLEAFLSWVLVVLVSAIMFMIFMIPSEMVETQIGILSALGVEGSILYLLIFLSAVVNLLFYGCITLLISLTFKKS